MGMATASLLFEESGQGRIKAHNPPAHCPNAGAVKYTFTEP